MPSRDRGETMVQIGIRREDKSHWEARTPLVPADVLRLIRDHGLEIAIQPSPNRAFDDDAYRQAGATLTEDLSACPVILGVKEIPPAWFERGKTYVYFSHTIKGQPDNMPALRRLMDLKGQLIDYERIVDEEGRRLVFFGRFAGLAGMIDTLWALGRRLRHEGLDTPLAAVQPAHRYRDLDHAREAIRETGDRIRTQGLPDVLRPFVCGFAGYGQVSQGAQEIYDLLPVEEVTPEALATLDAAAPHCHKVVFREEHLAEPIDGSASFRLQEYYDHPDRYRAAFFRHVPHLTALVNGIYWEPKYPPLITREQFATLYADGASPRLRVVGDITCDIDGSLACTTRATTPDSPVYTYDPTTGQTIDGVAGRGPVVLAVDFLPCELPVDASVAFSRAVSPLIPGLAKADFAGDLANSGLPSELARATIVYQGELTEPYRSLRQHLDKSDSPD